ncbi:MAG TPA: sulfatase [Bacteroidales bacterium]|nr:sulfatase [Bacteroidales bacterium]
MPKHRITSQVILTTLSGGLLATSCATSKKEFKTTDDKPLNIIYIMSDDHTRQAISAYSDRYGLTTPNIDKIAEEGLIFRNSFVANSISGPSRACLMTGKHSHKNGFMNNQNHFDGSQQTMPKLLQKAGYQTAMIGKWHLHSDPTGFDHWDILPGQGDFYSPVMYTKDKRTTYPGVYVTDLITDKSIDWLEGRDKDKPFCLFVHHKAVHRNFMGNVYMDLNAFEDRDYPLPDNFYDDYEGREAAAGQEMTIDKHYSWDYDLKVKSPDGTPAIHGFGGYNRMNEYEKAIWDSVYNPIQREINEKNLKGKEMTEWKYQRYVKDYLKTAQAMDESIGRLMKYLKDNDLLENTLIIYTSDQGFYMGEHGWFDKRFMYEESFSTPLIMRLPQRFKAKGEVTEFVQNIDHAPTFLEIAGAKIPEDIQGVSYLPLLKKQKPKNWRKAVYYHFYEFPGEHAVRRHYGIRTEQYKLIHFYHDIDTWELYDLKNDPGEMKNLINDPAQAENIKSLKKQLWDLQVLYDDPIREKYPL